MISISVFLTNTLGFLVVYALVIFFVTLLLFEVQVGLLILKCFTFF
jgi:hypothetical protein